MLEIPNIFKNTIARAQKLRGRFTSIAVLYVFVGLFFFTGSATATNAYITGETPKEFLTRLSSGVRPAGEEQKTLVLGAVVKDNEEEAAPVEEVENEEDEPADTTSSPTVSPVGAAPTTPATEPVDTTGDTTAADPAPEEQKRDGSNDVDTGAQTSDTQDDTPQQPDPTPEPEPEPEPADSPEMASLAEYISKALGFLNEADGFTGRYSQILTKLVNNESGLAASLQHLESDLSNFWVRVAASTAYLVTQPTTDEADEYAHSFRDHMKSWREKISLIVKVSESYSMLVPLSETEINKLLDYVDGPRGQEADSHYAAAEEDLNKMVAILEAYCLENTHDPVCK